MLPLQRFFAAVLCSQMLMAMPATSQAQDAVADRVERILSLPADLDHGRETFSRSCASCHGVFAQGNADLAYPALAGQRPNYLVKQLADVIEADRAVPEMHRTMSRWQSEDPQTLRDVAAFLAALDPVAQPQRGSGQQPALGRQLYEADCAGCHGRFGEGDNPGYVPALRGQHYTYLRRQMQSLGTGHRTGMDGVGRERLARLTSGQLDAIADHLSRLPSERDAVPDGNPFVPGGE
jgi:cytochrome c553